MSGNEMFVSALRSAGDEAGVFEYDGETGYFYLYATKCKENEVLGAICVVIGVPDFGEIDVAIRWNAEQSKVGLFIRGRLWAAFDGVTGAKYGGNYRENAHADVPAQIVAAFEAQ